MSLFPDSQTNFEHTFAAKVRFLSNVDIEGTLKTAGGRGASGSDGSDSAGSSGGIVATNISGGVQGSIPYQSDTDVTGFLAPGSAGYFLKTNGPGANPEWAEVAAPVEAIPSGTTMVFYQAAAPTGWTKQTTHNDKSLRVVSGTGGGNGGSSSFSSVFASRTPTGSVSSSFSGSTNGASANISVSNSSISISVNSHTLSTSELASHTHGGFRSGNWRGTDDSGLSTQYGNTYDTAAQGGNGSHSHGISQSSHSHGISQSNHSHSLSGSVSSSFSGNAMDFAVQYIDVIICSRN